MRKKQTMPLIDDVQTMTKSTGGETGRISAAGTISEDISGVSFAAQSIFSTSNEVKDSSKALLDRATELNEIVGKFKV